MPLPLAREGLIVKALDSTQPRRSGKCRNVFPFLVTLQNFHWHHARKLLFYPTVLLNTPHVISYIYYKWYVNPARNRRDNPIPLSPLPPRAFPDFPARHWSEAACDRGAKCSILSGLPIGPLADKVGPLDGSPACRQSRPVASYPLTAVYIPIPPSSSTRSTISNPAAISASCCSSRVMKRSALLKATPSK